LRVLYSPTDWRPSKALDKEILTLFTLLHVVEPIDRLTLRVLKSDFVSIEQRAAWACYSVTNNTIYLPAYRPLNSMFSKEDHFMFILWNLAHEYVHAIRARDGRPDENHRGVEQEINGLYNKLTRET